MLNWLYEHFNFLGSLLILWFGLFVIIFWIAGMAGIMILPPRRTKNFKLILGVVFPPFTVGWMIYEMFRQKRALKEN